jgi:hypothetical protein
MFKHANGSHDMLMELFTKNDGLFVDVLLAGESVSIRFTKTHITDLKAVILSERKKS